MTERLNTNQHGDHSPIRINLIHFKAGVQTFRYKWSILYSSHTCWLKEQSVVLLKKCSREEKNLHWLNKPNTQTQFILCYFVYMWRTLPPFQPQTLRSVCLFTDGTIYIITSLRLKLSLYFTLLFKPSLCSLQSSRVCQRCVWTHLHVSPVAAVFITPWWAERRRRRGEDFNTFTSRSRSTPDRWTGSWEAAGASEQTDWRADELMWSRWVELLSRWGDSIGWQAGRWACQSVTDRTPAAARWRIRSDQTVSEWVWTSSSETSSAVN